MVAAGDRDPFDEIDAGPDPEIEESILLNRMSGSYYPTILDWFFERLPAVSSSTRVLEVGCGTGEVLDRLVRHAGVAHAAGVDLSAFLAERAAQRFPQYAISAGDGAALPFPDASFDLTYTATVLVHAANPQAILKEMHRVTRPGGTVSVLDQDFGSAVLYPGDRALNDRVLAAATDFWQDGGIGRRLPSLMVRAGLPAPRLDATVRIDRTLDEPFFARIRDWVVSAGFPADDADRWMAGVVDEAKTDEFVFTRNFYACVARRPD